MSNSNLVINSTLSKAITSEDGFHHLVYSISGNTHTLFLDNSAIAVNISGGNVFSSYQTISNLFCGIAGDLSYGYTGYIDDFKVYNRALALTDVSAIYNANVPTTTSTLLYNPIAYYALDVPNGINLIDSVTGLSTAVYNTTLSPNTYVNTIVGTGGSIQTSFKLSGAGCYYNTSSAKPNNLFLNPVNIGSSTGITFCGWFYMTSSPSIYSTLVEITSTLNKENNFPITFLKIGNNSLGWFFDSVNTNASTDTRTTIQFRDTTNLNNLVSSTNIWNFLAFTVNSSRNVSCYAYNATYGLLSNSFTIQESFSTWQNKPLYTSVGYGRTNSFGDGSSMVGYIDNVSIYNTALSSTQIRNIISALIPIDNLSTAGYNAMVLSTSDIAILGNT